MDKLEIKDNIHLIVMNTFHTEVDLDCIMNGTHNPLVEFKDVPESEIVLIIQEMINDGHLEFSDREYKVTDSGHKIFSSGGYINNLSKSF